jgi:hypothetical protein
MEGNSMALTRAKYKRVPDLYIVGKELVLRDGTVMWMQALNPLQRDEAQSDAQAARSRLILALKSDHGSDERAKVTGAFVEDGRDKCVGRLVESKVSENIAKLVAEIQDDPDWKERLEILRRQDELMARPPEDAERKLVEDLNEQYIDEVVRRQDDERAFLKRRYEALPDDQLVEDYIDLYIDRRGGEMARVEYELTEVWLSARACDAVEVAEGEWDHSNCEGHVLQAYETKAEREAKNSHRQGSSSDSSPLPSAPVESTRSTQNETPSKPRGTSPSPSGTP